MTPADLSALLQEFYRETLDLMNGRQTIARAVEAYDANNGYQQVLGRQEVHLQWLSAAIGELGGPEMDASGPREGGAPSRERAASAIEADGRDQKAFIDRWSPRVSGLTHARDRKMLELILGEMKEHLRILQQAAEGRTDLLGRHSDGKVLRGRVLPIRPGN